MDSEAEVVGTPNAKRGDKGPQGADATAAEVQPTIRQSAGSSPHPPGLHFKDGRQLARGLGLSFAVLIAILLGAGYWCSERIVNIDMGLEHSLGQTMSKLQLTNQAMRYSNENRRITFQLFLKKKTGSSDLLRARTVENSLRISGLITALEQQSETPKERELLLSVKQARVTYLNSNQRALKLFFDSGDKDMAEALLLEQVTPAFFAYQTAWNDFAQFEMDQVRVVAERDGKRDLTTRNVGLSLTGVTGVLMAGFAVFVTRRIDSEARARDSMHEKVRSLNAELEQRVAQRTEELARADDQVRRSLKELQEYTEEIETINELVELLQSCLTLDEAHQQACRVLQQFFPSGAVLMLNSSRNLLDVVVRWGGPSRRPGPFPPDSCWALRKGRAHVVQPDNLSLLCGHTDDTSGTCHLCIPMVAQGESLGVLSIDGSELCCAAANPQMIQHKQELATTMAEQISLAFANLTLRETLKYQSVRDPLTGLFNRRHMEESLERELLRAARNVKPVTVLMIDIDHFKRFNDSFGHDAGDVLLQELGALFNSQTRGGDIACRYGGEEFLLIMAETSLATGRERAMKLKEQVAHLQVRHHGETFRRITVSIGVAGFPEHGTSAAQVVGSADHALYRAKAEGRDRVVVAAAAAEEASLCCVGADS